ncbi:Rpp14/Pop5 family protein [Halorhabdus amylolytica]|uniref:Rpp14/Pop5 family protein n=1 Tax=Halorhabdus amylolytica TaxID=2559573 RepID=UPI0010AAA91B|nr:Rpp14/Pop5 family protein [Halorhabdus amylolytica]
MKPLPKHVRQRWRYLAVGIETWPDVTIDRRAFQRHLWFAAQNLLGDVGSAATDLSVMQFGHDEGTGSAIVRTRRGSVSDARAVLTCLSEVDGNPIGLRVRGVSGTVRACEEKYLGGRGEATEHGNVAFEGAERPAISRDSHVDVRVETEFVGATQRDIS